jgi:hypothetical protein
VDTALAVAQFRQDDPTELVLASLACPFCLRSRDVDWRFESGGYDPSVECVCPRCEQRWRVFMTPHQALRLVLLESSLA